MKIRIDIEDEIVQDALSRLIAFGSNPAQAMKEIANEGRKSTRDRFSEGVGPDGKAWKTSQRVQDHGGRTLIMEGNLLDSITSQSDSNSAEWGANRIYAAIHQFGGEIHAKNAKSLFFRLPDGSARSVKKVTIPPRPYLGFNAEDAENILDIINQNLEKLLNA